MSVVLLQFDRDSDEDTRLAFIQAQIDEINESASKVRRRLFAEIGELKKRVVALEKDNESLKNELGLEKNDKIEWVYSQNGCLFDVREYREA